MLKKELMKKYIPLLFMLSMICKIYSQDIPIPKTMEAYRISESISIDGRLEESAWKMAQPASEFIQLEPNTGKTSRFDTKVYVIYDDEAIYIGAKMSDNHPDSILLEMSLRDNFKNADNFILIIDSYQSGQYAFAFGVSASDIQMDFAVNGEFEDTNWNAVWESRTSIDEEGWIAEFKIPYSALRFSDKEIQTWNIQFTREIRRYREKSFWNPVDPEISGYVNQSGVLNGIKDIKTPIRLSLTPFVATYVNTSYDPSTQTTTSGTAYNAGMDLKYGISDAYTLDMTLIPDFGQTITDPRVLNLSPYEVFFDENRQFFTEGLELFDNQNLFYSRRVGGQPFDYFAPYKELKEGETLVDNPNTTGLYNATKISGRNSSGLGLGFFNAIEKEQYAIIRDTFGNERKIRTNPLTNYNVLVLDQNLPNNSTLKFMNSNVLREGHARDANNSGLQVKLKTKDQKYSLYASASISQRFDSGKVDRGYAHTVSLEKISGKWLYGTGYWFESDNFNPNDLGLLFAPNEKGYYAYGGLYDYKPKSEKLQFHRHNVNIEYSRLHRPNEFSYLFVSLDNFYLYKSRFAWGFRVGGRPSESRDYFEPRSADFSLYLPIPKTLFTQFIISTDYRKTLAADANVICTFYDAKNRYLYEFNLFPRVRFTDKFSVNFGTSYQIEKNNQGYIFVSDIDINPGSVPIGTRDRSIVTNFISASYIFTNKMGIDLFARHYWDKVRINNIEQLSQNGKLSPVSFSDYDLYNINYNFFSVDFQYSWRFAPGSDLIFVWKNIIDSNTSELDSNYFSSYNGLFNNIQYNNFSLKMVYYIDANKILK